MADLFLLLDEMIPIKNLLQGYVPQGYRLRESVAGGLYFEKKDQSFVIFDPVAGPYDDWAETQGLFDIEFTSLWIIRIWMQGYKDLYDFLPGLNLEGTAYVDNDRGLLMPLPAFIDYYRGRPDWDWRLAEANPETSSK